MKTRLLNLSLAALALTACKTLPEVPLTTPKPLEVNLNMRLDVYQYRGDEPQDKEAVKSIDEATQRQRNRMEEIQTLKNNRLVIENSRGLLSLRVPPAGDWGAYVKRTIEDENKDRDELMRHQARQTNKALHEIQTEQWKMRIEKAFKGEWIEVPGDTPATFKQVQAEGPGKKGSGDKPVADAPPPAVEGKKEAGGAAPSKP